MSAPNGDPAEAVSTDTPKSDSTNDPAPKEMSKRALEKARKKAEKAVKKAEYAVRPKETQKDTKPKSIFEEGWLKKTFEDKPVSPGAIQTRFPPEPNLSVPGRTLEDGYTNVAIGIVSTRLRRKGGKH